MNRGWHENGQLAWQMTYVDGEREGRAVWYDADGHILAEGVYVAGALHGLYVEYAPDGAVKGTEHWDRGRRVVQGELSEAE